MLATGIVSEGWGESGTAECVRLIGNNYRTGQPPEDKILTHRPITAQKQSAQVSKQFIFNRAADQMAGKHTRLETNFRGKLHSLAFITFFSRNCAVSIAAHP
jgi:hypothetical protein